jgi:hypothetical protein
MKGPFTIRACPCTYRREYQGRGGRMVRWFSRASRPQRRRGAAVAALDRYRAAGWRRFTLAAGIALVVVSARRAATAR